MIFLSVQIICTCSPSFSQQRFHPIVYSQAPVTRSTLRAASGVSPRERRPLSRRYQQLWIPAATCGGIQLSRGLGRPTLFGNNAISWMFSCQNISLEAASILFGEDQHGPLKSLLIFLYCLCVAAHQPLLGPLLLSGGLHNSFPW